MAERKWDEGETGDVYVDDEGEKWEIDPTDPRHPDFDLSEAADYPDWEQRRGWFPLRRWIILLVTIVILFALFWPLCARVFA